VASFSLSCAFFFSGTCIGRVGSCPLHRMGQKERKREGGEGHAFSCSVACPFLIGDFADDPERSRVRERKKEVVATMIFFPRLHLLQTRRPDGRGQGGREEKREEGREEEKGGGERGAPVLDNCHRSRLLKSGTPRRMRRNDETRSDEKKKKEGQEARWCDHRECGQWQKSPMCAKGEEEKKEGERKRRKGASIANIRFACYLPVLRRRR